MNKLLVYLLVTAIPALCAERAVRLARNNSPRRSASESARHISRAVLGYVVQSTPLEVRAVLGVPGSSRFSEPLVLPESTIGVRMAPGHEWALVMREGLPPLAWQPETDQRAQLDLIDGTPDQIAFSPSGFV